VTNDSDVVVPDNLVTQAMRVRQSRQLPKIAKKSPVNLAQNECVEESYTVTISPPLATELPAREVI